VALASLLVVGGIGRHVYRLCDAKCKLAQRRRSRRAMAASTRPQEQRRDIVVILGVDATDYGKDIVQHFLDNGYIVIASTLSTEVADEIEKIGNGYARALVLDAEEPGSVPHFLRSLTSTLSLRFPTNANGDPYASTTSSTSNLPRVVSLISLLSLAPWEYLTLSEYDSPIIFHESTNHQMALRAMTPLSVIQATLPHFKHRKALGSPSSHRNPSSPPCIILCVPAVARVGALGSSGLVMASEAATRGFEILRREVSVDPDLNGSSGLRFVTIDVGGIGDSAIAISTRRRPSDVSVLSKMLLGIVNERGCRCSGGGWLLDWMRSLWLGNRRRVGAGALTYTVASWLPGFILDFLLTLPYRLDNLRISLQEARQIESRDEPEIHQPTLEVTTPVVTQKKVDQVDQEDQDASGSIGDEPVSTNESVSEVDSGSVHSQDTQEDASHTSSIADSWVMHDGKDAVSPPNETT